MATLLIKQDQDGKKWELVLNEPWLTSGSADSTYLRLDCTNDPLTATLQTQAIEPSSSDIYDIGTSSTKYNRLHSTTILSVAKTGTPTASFSTSSYGVVSGYGEATSGGVANITGPSVANSYAVLFGASRAVAANVTTNLISSSEGSFVSGSVNAQANPGTYTLESSGQGAFASGAVVPIFGTTVSNYGRIRAIGTGAMAVGSVLNLFARDAEVLASGSAAFALGYILTNTGNGLVQATGNGSMAMGAVGSAGGIVQATAQGALAHGIADGNSTATQLTASGNGSFAQGVASGAAGVLQATNLGSVAIGASAGTLNASGQGSFATGQAQAGQTISVTASNAQQFGVGTNSIADTLGVGTTLRFKGTTGAPGTLRDGDMWVDATGYILGRSNGVNVQLGIAQTYGAPTGTATRTTFATGTVTLSGLAERVKALIDDLRTMNIIR